MSPLDFLNIMIHKQRRQSDDSTIHAMLQFNLYPSIIQRFIFYFPKGFYIKTALWLPPSLHYKSTKQKQNFEGTIQ